MTMLLDVAKIREPHLRIDRTDESVGVRRPTRTTGSSSRCASWPTCARITTKSGSPGAWTPRWSSACSRCLEGFRVPVRAPFDLLFLPAASEPASPEQEIEDDDLGTSYYRDGVIDLADVVREQLSLALPMKPLCQEGCRGLCPECGTNLNSGACDCAPRWEDPRLAPLKALTRTNDDA